MNKEMRDIWVAALRSGVYRQGRGQLYNKESDSYCCLGVLAEVCLVSNNSLYKGFGTLRPCQLEEARLSYGQAGQLMEMNDGTPDPKFPRHHQKKSFKEIADWIEVNLWPVTASRNLKMVNKKFPNTIYATIIIDPTTTGDANQAGSDRISYSEHVDYEYLSENNRTVKVAEYKLVGVRTITNESELS